MIFPTNRKCSQTNPMKTQLWMVGWRLESTIKNLLLGIIIMSYTVILWRSITDLLRNRNMDSTHQNRRRSLWLCKLIRQKNMGAPSISALIYYMIPAWVYVIYIYIYIQSSTCLHFTVYNIYICKELCTLIWNQWPKVIDTMQTVVCRFNWQCKISFCKQ